MKEKLMKTLPAKMTHAWLVDNGACLEHRKMFSAEWPEGAEVTKVNLHRAAEIGLDLEWLAKLLLPPAACDEYERQLAPVDDEYQRQREVLQAEYRRQLAPVDDEYQRQREVLQAEYRRQLAPVDDEYQRQLAPLYAEYQRQCDALYAEYQRQCDALLIRAFIASRFI